MIRKEIESVVELPEGFQAEVQGRKALIRGNGKEIEKAFRAKGVSLSKENNSIKVVGKPASRKMHAVVNSITSHLNNMVEGLKAEYTYRLAIVYSHFPMNVSVKGSVVEINNFVGEKKARVAKVVQGATVTVKGKEVLVKGNSKEAAGQTAANIENATKVKGKDKRIYQDGIFIAEKAVQVAEESK